MASLLQRRKLGACFARYEHPQKRALARGFLKPAKAFDRGIKPPDMIFYGR